MREEDCRKEMQFFFPHFLFSGNTIAFQNHLRAASRKRASPSPL
jgi:hypothetical protein